MSAGYGRGQGDGLDRLIEDIRAIERRLRELEIPTGTQTASLVAQVQAKLAELTATVNDLVADAMENFYTKSETDAKVASPGDIAPGNVTASGAVSGNTGTFAGGLNSIDARNRLLSTSYVSAYWDGSGQAGYVPSSLDVKDLIKPYVADLEAWLAQEPYWFSYKDDEAGTPRAGFIAQWLNEDFPEFVIHDDGEPRGIHYEFMIAAMQSAFRQHVLESRREIAELRAAVDELRG